MGSLQTCPHDSRKDFELRWKMQKKIDSKSKKVSKNLECSEIMLIFAASKGEFAERMTTFMACKGRFEPQK